MKFDPSRYYLYEEILELIKAWKDEYPDVVSLGSIGKSYDGRDIPLVTLTIGEGRKPGVLITGNLHSAELMGSCAVHAGNQDFIMAIPHILAPGFNGFEHLPSYAFSLVAFQHSYILHQKDRPAAVADILEHHAEQASANNACIPVLSHHQILLRVAVDLFQKLLHCLTVPGLIADHQHYLIQTVQVFFFRFAKYQIHSYLSL